MDQLLEGQWVQLFSGLDVGMLLAIAAVTFVLERSETVNDRWAMLVPLVAGAAWGAVQGYEAGFAFGTHLFKGAVLNGAGASFIARGAKKLLRAMWDAGNGPATKP